MSDSNLFHKTFSNFSDLWVIDLSQAYIADAIILRHTIPDQFSGSWYVIPPSFPQHGSKKSGLFGKSKFNVYEKLKPELLIENFIPSNHYPNPKKTRRALVADDVSAISQWYLTCVTHIVYLEITVHEIDKKASPT